MSYAVFCLKKTKLTIPLRYFVPLAIHSSSLTRLHVIPTHFPSTTLFRSDLAHRQVPPHHAVARQQDRRCLLDEDGGLIRLDRRKQAPPARPTPPERRSEEHTSELQSRRDVVCRLLLEKNKANHSPPLLCAAGHSLFFADAPARDPYALSLHDALPI